MRAFPIVVTPAIRTAAGEFLKSYWGHCPTIGRIDVGNIREIDRQLLRRISEELSHNLLSMTTPGTALGSSGTTLGTKKPPPEG